MITNASTSSATLPQCNIFRQLVTSGQERTAQRDWYNQETGHLYFIRVEHRSGKSKVVKDSFLKIGISSQKDVTSRFNLMPQCYHVTLLEDMVLPLADVKRLEKELHRHFKSFQYIPVHKRFNGKTECFRLSLIDSFPTLASMIADLKPAPEPDNSNVIQMLN